MSEYSNSSHQGIMPMLAYCDAPAAIDFLIRAFGFEERYRMAMEDGRIGHAEVALNDNIVMLATTWKAAGMSAPVNLAGVHSQLYCEVADVDLHYAGAVEAGATVISEPVDQPYGARTYRAIDPEGHRWIFATPSKSQDMGENQK